DEPVADLARRPVRAPVDLAVEQEPHADAGADGDAGAVGHTPERSLPVLAPEDGVHVVLHVDGALQLSPKVLPQGDGPGNGPPVTRRGSGSSRGAALSGGAGQAWGQGDRTPLGIGEDRKSTRLNSSHVKISYAVFCLKK